MHGKYTLKRSDRDMGSKDWLKRRAWLLGHKWELAIILSSSIALIGYAFTDLLIFSIGVIPAGISMIGFVIQD